MQAGAGTETALHPTLHPTLYPTLQAGADTEAALREASVPCLAALIKLYLREVLNLLGLG